MRERRGESDVCWTHWLDRRNNIPTFVLISDGRLHDVNVLDRHGR